MISRQAAMTTADHAKSASALLEIHDKISCPQDRRAIRGVVQTEFASYSKDLKSQIEFANVSISYTKKPGVAAEAIRIGDDFRQLQALFDWQNITKARLYSAGPRINSEHHGTKLRTGDLVSWAYYSPLPDLAELLRPLSLMFSGLRDLGYDCLYF